MNYEDAKANLLITCLHLMDFSLSEESEQSARGEVARQLKKDAEIFKKALRKRGQESLGLGYVRFSTAIKMLECKKEEEGWDDPVIEGGIAMPRCKTKTWGNKK